MTDSSAFNETSYDSDDLATAPDSAGDQLQPEDTLVDRRGNDVLDEGYTPSNSPSEDLIKTPREQLEGDSLDERLAKETPDPSAEVLEPDESPDNVRSDEGSPDE